MNSDYSQRVVIDTNTLKWKPTSQEGVFKKLLSCDDQSETAFIKLTPGAVLSTAFKTNTVEIVVLEGKYVNEYGVFETGDYLRFPYEDEISVSSLEGCVIFRKTTEATRETPVIVSTKSSSWLPGQGRLEVMPLHEQTALVKWPKGEKFIPHKHWGGEEILVLSGMFIDEHGNYPKGTWLRSPHLSSHFPYVDEETIIWVKTGHL